MVPPIWIGCDADATIKLINQGMDLTHQTSFFNETVLYHWAGGLDLCEFADGLDFCEFFMDPGISYQEDSLRVVKLLVRKGADLLALNSWGFTPLIEAANGPCHGLPNLKVLDFLLERDEYSQAEKIEAMELAGAVILQNEKNPSLFPKCFDYWRKALQLRQMEGSGFIEKPRSNPKHTQTIEWSTSAELEDVMNHPDKFVIQSFLVRLRILSSKSWSAINCLILSNLLGHCFAELQQRFKLDEIFEIIWATLEHLLSRSDLRENKVAQGMIGQVVEELIPVFSCLNTDSSEIRTKEVIKTSLDLIASATEFYELVTCSWIRLVRYIHHLPQRLLNTDAIETLSKVRDQRGQNLLYEAIGVARFDDNLYATVRLLLYAGCDPNAIDNNGNTTLHLLAKIDQQYLKGDLNTIAVLLLDFGAQLSRKNADGKTAVDLLIRKNKRKRNKNADQGIIGWKLPDWCTELPTLTCLSARVIRCSRIPYLELPATLIPMIEKHNIT